MAEAKGSAPRYVKRHSACLHCGAALGRKNKFCSAPCQRRARGIPPRGASAPSWKPKPCAHCGSVFAPTAGAKKLCSDACRKAHRRSRKSATQRRFYLRKAALKRCQQCGGAVPPGRGKFCTAACLKASMTPFKSGAVQRACLSCGVDFVATHITRRCCSEVCAARRARDKAGARSVNVAIRLSARVRCGMRRDLRTKKGGRQWESLVGYTVAELMRHLEARFAPGMGWHNLSKWHVDHVRPLASFSFSSVDDPEFRAAWALTNLQPLWAEDNLRKGSRYGVPIETAFAQGDQRKQAA